MVQSLQIPFCAYSVKSWILNIRPSWTFVRFLYPLGLAGTTGLVGFRGSLVEVYGSAKQ